MNSYSKRSSWRLKPARAVALVLFIALTATGFAEGRRIIPGHIVPASSQVAPISSLRPTNHLSLVLGLALRNQPELNSLLQNLHDPASTNYHRWLTPDQFVERFGPTETDYQKVVRFAGQSGFEVTEIHSNRMMVNVEATVASIEKAFNLTLRKCITP